MDEGVPCPKVSVSSLIVGFGPINERWLEKKLLIHNYRDIPLPLVTSGCENSGNLRELALNRMKDFGAVCRDVRFREVGVSPAATPSLFLSTFLLRSLSHLSDPLCWVYRRPIRTLHYHVDRGVHSIDLRFYFIFTRFMKSITKSGQNQ